MLRDQQGTALEGMDRPGSSKRTKCVEVLPHDVLQIIFSRLEFRDKVRAGLVCKQWDQLLKTGSLPAKHWEVHYNINKIVSRTAYKRRGDIPELADGILRYATIYSLAQMGLRVKSCEWTVAVARVTACRTWLVPGHVQCLSCTAFG